MYIFSCIQNTIFASQFEIYHDNRCLKDYFLWSNPWKENCITREYPLLQVDTINTIYGRDVKRVMVQHEAARMESHALLKSYFDPAHAVSLGIYGCGGVQVFKLTGVGAQKHLALRIPRVASTLFQSSKFNKPVCNDNSGDGIIFCHFYCWMAKAQIELHTLPIELGKLSRLYHLPLQWASGSGNHISRRRKYSGLEQFDCNDISEYQKEPGREATYWL